MQVIGQRIKQIFEEIRQDVPNLNHMTFEISSNLTTKEVYGWYHIGDYCHQYNSIDDFIVEMEDLRGRNRKNEILFRKFG